MSTITEETQYIDLDDFHSLVFKIKGDGRQYLANIRTDNWVVGDTVDDVWQAFLFARKGEWHEVEIPFERFLLTWRGRVVDQEVEMNRGKILSLGISLVGGEDAEEGEYGLGIQWIAARNHANVVTVD